MEVIDNFKESIYSLIQKKYDFKCGKNMSTLDNFQFNDCDQNSQHTNIFT